ncbi:MAG TPA: nucleotidyltransferase family protein, partial [Desulfatiglandales bacterium]|nr:nucleotidyltransferase family protein [Desulfatiglandales bacterium]
MLKLKPLTAAHNSTIPQSQLPTQLLTTFMTIEEHIVLQYALPRFNREDASWWWCEEVGCQGQVNWDRVLELALFHDVLPSVYRNLEDTGWLAVPDDAVRKFREKWHQHLARNLILSHELDRVLELFAKRRVKAIPLKGVLLAGLFYPDITLRSFSDLDIWVRPMDLKEAGEILRQTGYEPRFTLDQDYTADRDYSVENVCDILFHRCLPQGSRIGIELHRCLAKPRDYPAIPEEKWWHQAQEVRINGQLYFSLAPEDMLIYLALKI